jgi:hypothetical protein
MCYDNENHLFLGTCYFLEIISEKEAENLWFNL